MKVSLNRTLTRCSFILCLLVLTFACEQKSFAQGQLSVKPTQLYKFRIRNDTLGYLLTPYYSEGVYHGYTFEGTIGSIYVPPPGYTPDPSAGLVPLHQWTVIEHGRAYAAYSHVYTATGSNYHYDGIRGYLYNPAIDSITLTFDPNNPQQVFLSKIIRRYSQTYGFWYGNAVPYRTDVSPILYTISQPPTSSFDGIAIIGGYLQTVCGTSPSLPSSAQVPESAPWQGCDAVVLGTPAITFNAPPPPPTCDTIAEQACYNNSGIWNSASCTCSYYPPDPCRQGRDVSSIKENQNMKAEGRRPPDPCEYSPY